VSSEPGKPAQALFTHSPMAVYNSRNVFAGALFVSEEATQALRHVALLGLGSRQPAALPLTFGPASFPAALEVSSAKPISLCLSSTDRRQTSAD
jgi:hypothetical protein